MNIYTHFYLVKKKFHSLYTNAIKYKVYVYIYLDKHLIIYATT